MAADWHSLPGFHICAPLSCFWRGGVVFSGYFSFLRYETLVVSLLCPPAVENTHICSVDETTEASLINRGVGGRSSNPSPCQSLQLRNPLQKSSL